MADWLPGILLVLVMAAGVGFRLGRSTRELACWTDSELLDEVIRRRHEERVRRMIDESIRDEVNRQVARGEKGWMA